MYEANGQDDDVVIVRHSREADVTPEPVTTDMTEEVYYRPYPAEPALDAYMLRKVNQIIWLVAVVLEVLIAFRVFLKLIAANPQSGFASFIYSVTAPFLAPFAGLTSTPTASGSVLEISSIIAMAVYALVFWLIAYVVRLVWGR